MLSTICRLIMGERQTKLQPNRTEGTNEQNEQHMHTHEITYHTCTQNRETEKLLNNLVVLLNITYTNSNYEQTNNYGSVEPANNVQCIDPKRFHVYLLWSVWLYYIYIMIIDTNYIADVRMWALSWLIRDWSRRIIFFGCELYGNTKCFPIGSIRWAFGTFVENQQSTLHTKWIFRIFAALSTFNTTSTILPICFCSFRHFQSKVYFLKSNCL